MRQIPGIGETFSRDLPRIGITTVQQLVGQDPELLFQQLQDANLLVSHATSRNYLCVLRMAVYYADGGRDPGKLKWNVWKQANVGR